MVGVAGGVTGVVVTGVVLAGADGELLVGVTLGEAEDGVPRGVPV